MVVQIIERSLPKKPKLKKDPSVIEREEMEKLSKFWVNIARKEIPKHHRIFTNFHRKQLTDAKRVSETCQREVCANGDIFFATCGFPFPFFVVLMNAWHTFLVLQLYIVTNALFWILFQVKMKVSRSLKLMRGAAIRTRKLARDMLVFWKRVDKEMVHFLFVYCFQV